MLGVIIVYILNLELVAINPSYFPFIIKTTPLIG